MFLTFRARVLRALPFYMGGAFLIAFVGALLSAWVRSKSIDIGRMLLLSAAFAFVWTSVAAPMTAYYLRKEERIPLRTSATLRMFAFSLVWCFAFAALGFMLMGCATSAGACLTPSDFSNAAIVAIIVGGLLSLVALSS